MYGHLYTKAHLGSVFRIDARVGESLQSEHCSVKQAGSWRFPLPGRVCDDIQVYTVQRHSGVYVLDFLETRQKATKDEMEGFDST